MVLLGICLPAYASPPAEPHCSRHTRWPWPAPSVFGYLQSEPTRVTAQGHGPGGDLTKLLKQPLPALLRLLLGHSTNTVALQAPPPPCLPGTGGAAAGFTLPPLELEQLGAVLASMGAEQGRCLHSGWPSQTALRAAHEMWPCMCTVPCAMQAAQ